MKAIRDTKNNLPAALDKVSEYESRLKYIYRKSTSKPIKIFAREVYDLFTKRKIRDENFGNVDAAHFKKWN